MSDCFLIKINEMVYQRNLLPRIHMISLNGVIDLHCREACAWCKNSSPWFENNSDR